VSESQLDKPDVIDLVSLNAAGDEVTVSIVATRPWDAQGSEALKLQAKLKNTVAFATDGQLTRMYPDTAGTRVRVNIDSQYPLGETETRLVDLARTHWCEPEGISLTWSCRDPA
jgi:hypothetical protein